MRFKLEEGNNSFQENSSEESGTYSIEQAEKRFYVKWHYNARNEIKTFTPEFFSPCYDS